MHTRIHGHINNPHGLSQTGPANVFGKGVEKLVGRPTGTRSTTGRISQRANDTPGGCEYKLIVYSQSTKREQIHRRIFAITVIYGASPAFV